MRELPAAQPIPLPVEKPDAPGKYKHIRELFRLYREILPIVGFAMVALGFWAVLIYPGFFLLLAFVRITLLFGEITPKLIWIIKAFRELTGIPRTFHRTTLRVQSSKPVNKPQDTRRISFDGFFGSQMAGPSKAIRFPTNPTKTAIVILSLFLPTGAIWFGSDVCTSVMFFVAVFSCQGWQGTRTVSLRGMIFLAAILETVRENNPVAAPDKVLTPSICSI